MEKNLFSRFHQTAQHACSSLMHAVIVCITLSALTTLTACVDSSAPTQPVIPPKDLLMTLVVDPDWAVMAVDSTLPITVSARNILGESLPVDYSEIEWISSDTTIATVDSHGIVHAKKVTSASSIVTITARWTHHASTKDTIVKINVTQTQRPISSLRVVPLDSTRTSWWYEADLFDGYTWVSVLTGAEDPQNPFDYMIFPLYTDSTVGAGRVGVFPFGDLGVMFGKTPYAINSRMIGDYWLYTHASIYGIPMRDSLKLTGLYAYDAQVPLARDSATGAIVSRFINNEVIVQPCGEVKFQNQLSTPIDIVFDDPSKATGCTAFDPTGNIEAIPSGGTGRRKFRAVGTVRWTLRDRESGQLLPSVTGTITMKQP